MPDWISVSRVVHQINPALLTSSFVNRLDGSDDVLKAGAAALSCVETKFSANEILIKFSDFLEYQ